MTEPSSTGRLARTQLTVPASGPSPASSGPGRRRDVPMAQIVAAGWQQHRSTVLISVAAVLIASAAVIAISRFGAPGEGAVSPQTVQLTLLLVDLYGLGVGVFLAAPLLAREYEHQTHLFAWSQDVSPARWLTGQTTLLLATAVGSALVLGFATQQLVLTNPTTRDVAFDVPYFDASPLAQIGHVVFAFALGLAIGMVVKRTVLAMTLTFVGFLTVRIVTAFWIRPYYLPPVRTVTPLGQGGDNPGLLVDFGYLTGSGQPAALPQECRRSASGDVLDCLARYDITAQYVDNQSLGRLATFHLVETGLALAVALVLLALTWITLRRATRG